MELKFFFDECLGQDLAKGLSLAGKNVEHLRDNFDSGTKDVCWLVYVGKNKLILVTKDKNIRRKPNEKALLLKYGVVAFYLGGSEKIGHDILKQHVNAWDAKEAKAKVQFKKGVAGVFIVRPGGGNIDPIPLT